MKVKIWGSRGSIPAPIGSAAIEEKIVRAILNMPKIDPHDEDAVRSYIHDLHILRRGTAGGNTCCLEIRSGHDIIVIDAGSGMRELGQDLMKGPCGRGKGVIHLLFTHLHWDHIQGFPFFLPAFVPGNRLLIYGMHDIESALAMQQSPLTFPVDLSYMQAERKFIHIQPGESFQIGSLHIKTLENFHPGRSLSYRLEEIDPARREWLRSSDGEQAVAFGPKALPEEHSSFDDRHFGNSTNSLVIATDAEYKELDEKTLLPYLHFCRNADVLIFDAQYTLRDVWKKVDWGHSSSMIGVDLARRAHIKKLVLFHHDPTYSDDEILDIETRAIAYQEQDHSLPFCEIAVAYDGMSFDVLSSGSGDYRMVDDGNLAILMPSGGQSSLDQAIDRLTFELSSTPWGENQEPTSSILDLANVETLTTASLKNLIMLRQIETDVSLVLAAPSQKVRQVIELAGYLDYFVIYPSVQEAIAAVRAREALNLPGQLLQNRYQIQHSLYSDPWANVLKAIDLRESGGLNRNRPVAIKIISPSFQSGTLQKVVQQLERVARIDHPNLVKILDWGWEGASFFIVEEYIEEDTLQSYLRYSSSSRRSGAQRPRRKPLSLRRVSQIAYDLITALEVIHSQGIVHGGFSMQSIFADQRSVRLGCFGLSWLIEGHVLLDVPSFILPVTHLSPEQILGQVMDARTDLYALGLVLYELFTGKPPFVGTDEAVKHAHLEEEPVPPRDHNPAISPSLEHLILRLLNKNPNDRYASASQVRRIWDSLGTNVEAGVQIRRKIWMGRREQVQTLLEAWKEVRSGYGQIVFISGEQGMGKTSLAHQFIAQSHSSVVLVGQSHEEDRSAYALFSDVLRAYFATIPPELTSEDAGQLLANLSRIVPEIRILVPGLPDLNVLAPEQEQLRLMASLVQFIGRATRSRPWLLVLDDLHQTDQSSLELLSYLGRHTSEMALLIVGIYSDGLARDHPLLEILQDLARHPGYRHISLQPISRNDVSQMLLEFWENAVPEPAIFEALVDKLYQHTRGNPYYVEEIAKALLDDGLLQGLNGGSIERRGGHGVEYSIPGDGDRGHRSEPDVPEDSLGILDQIPLPASVHEVVRRRIAHLTTGTQNLLQHAAVLGQTFRLDVLLAMMKLTEREALEALDIALERQLIQELPGQNLLAFRQVEIRQVLYDDLSPMRRRVLHQLAGETLERFTMPFPEQLADELAHHFELAGDFHKALIYILQSANQAKIAFANHQAMLWYNRALEILALHMTEDEAAYKPFLLSAHQNLGEVLALLGQYNAALSHFQVFLTIAMPGGVDHGGIENHSGVLENSDSPGLAATVCRLIASVHENRSEFDLSLEWLDKGMKLLDTHTPSQELVEIYNMLGWIQIRRGNFEASIVPLQKGLRMAEEIHLPQAEVESLRHLGTAAWFLGDNERSREYWQRSLRRCQDIGDIQNEGKVLNNLGLIHRDTGEYIQARNYYHRSLEISQMAGDRLGECVALNNLGFVWRNLGDFEQAGAYLHLALEICNIIGARQSECLILNNLGVLSYMQNDNPLALIYTQHALELSENLGARREQADALCTLGHILSSMGNKAEAQQAYRRSLALREELGQTNLLLDALTGLAEIAFEQNNTEDIENYARQILAVLNVTAFELSTSTADGLVQVGQAINGSEDPLRVYWICYRLLRFQKIDQADKILEYAHSLLEKQAQAIELSTTEADDLRRKFMQSNPVHQKIVDEKRHSTLS